MKNRSQAIGALSLMLIIFLLAALPALANNSVDEEIRQLREKLSTLEQKQLEFKKEAVAAEAALPSFSYRPGNGIMIEAADKAWGVQFGI